MFFTKSNTCPKCGKPVLPNVRFCGSCGASLSSNILTCRFCGTENNGTEQFCKQCGRELNSEPEQFIAKHSWKRDKNDFATRFEADDLPGWLRKGIIVEPGTKALLLEHGNLSEVLPPGEYFLNTIGKTILNWSSGKIPEKAVILLVDATPAELDFTLNGVYTNDPLRIGSLLRLQIEITDPEKFLINVFKSRDSYTLVELQDFLQPEVLQLTEGFISRYSVQQLTEQPELKLELEKLITDKMQVTLSQIGLNIIQIRTLELNLEILDESRNTLVKSALMDEELTSEMRLAESELNKIESLASIEEESKARLDAVRAEYEHRKAEAELAGRKRFLELQRERDLVNLTDETGKVEQEEKMAELYKRMRQAVMSDKMAELKSEEEFEVFLGNIDSKKLLRENDRQELIETWKAKRDDKQSARAHILAKLDSERNYELRIAELKRKKDLDEFQLETEINIAKHKREFDLETKKKELKQEFELEDERIKLVREREKTQLEIEKLKRQNELAGDKEESLLGMDLLGKMNQLTRLDEEEKRRIVRVDELERQKQSHKHELENKEIEYRQRAKENEFELRKIGLLKTLSPEALVTLSGPEQVQALVALKETEILKGMNSDQILAMAARNSPEIVKAITQARSEVSERERELHAQLDSQREATIQHERENSDKHRIDADKRAQDLKEAMAIMADVVKSQPRPNGEKQSVVVVPGLMTSNQSEATKTNEMVNSETKLCTNCGRTVPLKMRFCEHCGHAFEDVS